MSGEKKSGKRFLARELYNDTVLTLRGKLQNIAKLFFERCKIIQPSHFPTRLVIDCCTWRCSIYSVIIYIYIFGNRIYRKG